MAALNKVLVIGNLGRDPEVRQAGESPVADFSVACSEKFKGRDGKMQERTEWVNVVCWGRLAEIARDYLRKGMSVFVDGKLQTRKWKDRNGVNRWTTEVVAAQVLMLDRKRDDSSSSGGYDRRDGYDGWNSSAPDDDLPF